MRRNRMIFFAYVAVFSTGASGLIFQVTWQKYVSRLLGSDNIATAIILATFLGGLSLGYYLCGVFSAKIRNSFKAYAVLEGIIGLWCALFPNIFSGVERLSNAWSFAPPALIVVQGMFCAGLLMGVPTICMGGTLPFLTRGLARSLADATPVHANIYAINTIGAFVGTLCAGFYLIPVFGLPVTIIGASFINFSASLFFYLCSLSLKTAEATAPESDAIAAPSSHTRTFSAATLYLLALFSGFYVMTLENVLIRLMNLSVGSSSYSFSLIVAVFILAIAIGSWVVGKMRQISEYALYINQFVIAICLLLIYLSLDTWPYWAHVLRITFQPNIAGFTGFYVGLFLLLSAVLLVPVAFMGATLPLAFHELKRDLQHVGTHSGQLLAWNTLGSLLGSLVGGILLYYVFNNPQVFLVATVFAACSAVLAGWRLTKKLPVILAALVAVMSAAFVVWTPGYSFDAFVMGTFRIERALPYSFSGPTAFFETFKAGKSVKFYQDGPTATVEVIENPPHPRFSEPPRSIIINGKSDSNTIGDLYTLKLSAHLPSLLAESRDNVMVIGLGTGVTVGELTLYPEIQQIDIAEISPEVVAAFPLFGAATHNAHENPKVQMHIGDAFRILGRSLKKWDVIISEPSNPWVNGVDLLFTEEYYRLVREHLTENGLLLQWVQLYDTDPSILGMVLNTVRQSFPEARTFLGNDGDLLILAAYQPIQEERLRSAAKILAENQQVSASLAEIHLTSLDALLLREVWPPSYIANHFSNAGIQTMDNPRLHYIAGRAMFMGKSIPLNFLLNSSTFAYWQEYLLNLWQPRWHEFAMPGETLESMLFSTKNVITGQWFFTADPLKLHSYLNDPERFSLSLEEQRMIQMPLLRLIQAPTADVAAWQEAGLSAGAYQKNAELMFAYIAKYRNWLVPFHIDGLLALLQEGMSKAAEPVEQNWCGVQLARLLLQEGRDRAEAAAILSQLKHDADGNVFLRNEDQHVLQEAQYMLQMPEQPVQP